MEKKADPKRNTELWKRIETVYPDKPTQYKEEVYDFLCPEAKIARLKDHVAILEDIDILKERYLKKLATDRSAKGGKVSKKEPSFALLVQYAWEKSKRKTCLSMWKFLRKEFKEAERRGEKLIDGYDFVYEDETNLFTLYFQEKRKKPKDMSFRTFGRYLKDFKQELKNNCQ